MESPIERAAKEKCHLLKLDLPKCHLLNWIYWILVMPLCFVFLSVYIPLVDISNADCSEQHTRVQTGNAIRP